MDIDWGWVGNFVREADESVPDELVERIERGEIPEGDIFVSPTGFGSAVGGNLEAVTAQGRQRTKTVQIRIKTPEGKHEFEAHRDLGNDLLEALGRPTLR